MRARTRNWIFAIASIIFVAYLVVTAILANRESAQRLCKGIYIQVIDTARQRFVTAAELRLELGSLPMLARSMPASQINIDSLQRALSVIDKIEWVDIRRLTDGSIHITVEPMRPVARIFEPDRSYYINKDGKRIGASARYHVDVPVVSGTFADTSFTPTDLLPLLDYLQTDDSWSRLTTMIKVESPSDILIIPAIRGIVFNIGRPDNLPSKFQRLNLALNRILPAKGWNHYDTLSVKWQGQIVATRRLKAVADTTTIEADVRDDDDMATMTVADNVAAGQALPGHKAVSEKPIPGAARFKNHPDSSSIHR